MLAQIRPAFMLLLALSILTGLIYPLMITGLGRALAPHAAEGSLVERDGKIIGSHLIGQTFTDPGYFHGRPSATTDTDPSDATKTVAAPYNAANSGGSNLAPTSKALIDRVRDDVAALGLNGPVPVDLVTTSASGLDPDLSPAAALVQVPRVAAARGIPEAEVRGLIEKKIVPRWLGLLGEPVVNVLDLNLALDEMAPRPR